MANSIEDEEPFLEEDEGWEDEDEPGIPSIDGVPNVVDYSLRQPGDWVVSGPLVGWDSEVGRGRVFADVEDALDWARAHYGADRVSSWYGGIGRWAVLVKAVDDADD